MSDSNLYPRFRFIPNRGIIPDIPLPDNYQSLVPAFYAAGGKERIEMYARDAAQNASGAFDRFEPRFGWDLTRGLAHISLTPSSGLDLNNMDHFQEHNLGGPASLITGAIVMEYVAVLLNPHTR